AVVSERGRCREARIGKVGEVRRELMPCPAQLVYSGMARQADDRRGRHSLDVDAGLVESARAGRRATRREEGELEESRRLGAPTRTERGLIGRLGSREERFDATAGEDRDDRLHASGVVMEEVADGKTLELHSRIVAAGPLELVRPKNARDVGQNAGAIAFAVDDARTMCERGHAVEHEIKDRACRPRVLTRYRDQRTSIVLARHVPSGINKEAS